MLPSYLSMPKTEAFGAPAARLMIGRPRIRTTEFAEVRRGDHVHETRPDQANGRRGSGYWNGSAEAFSARNEPGTQRVCATIMPLEAALDELMARLADGDRSTFPRVFELLWGPVQKLCQNLLKNEADAKDAAQEAMQKIFQRASDYDKARPAIPWALALAGWECRTFARKRERRRETAEACQEERIGPHAEEELIQRDLTASALAALGGLSEADRQTLLATFWDEATPVAGATLRKRRERAVRRLREAFRRMYGLD